MGKIFVDCRSTVLNCSIGRIFKDKIFTVGQKTSKLAKKFSLEKFRLYSTFPI